MDHNAMTAPVEDLEFIDRYLQSLRLSPEARREAVGWLRLGQRLAGFALHAAGRPAFHRGPVDHHGDPGRGPSGL